MDRPLGNRARLLLGLRPKCRWGWKEGPDCQNLATVKFRVAERFGWRYSCDTHFSLPYRDPEQLRSECHEVVRLDD